MRISCLGHRLWEPSSLNHPELQFKYRFGQRSMAYEVCLSILCFQLFKGANNVFGVLALKFRECRWVPTLVNSIVGRSITPLQITVL